MKYLSCFAALLLTVVCFGTPPPGENPVEPLLIYEPPPRFAKAELVASEWTKYFISNRYCPPESVRYIALPRAYAGECDLIRSHYVADKLLMTITQSLGMFCIQANWVQDDVKAGTLAEVQAIAQLLFKEGSMIRLTETNPVDGFGIAEATASPGPRWVKALRWRRLGNGVAFCIFKFEGTTPMVSVGTTVSSNEYWYSPRPDPP